MGDYSRRRIVATDDVSGSDRGGDITGEDVGSSKRALHVAVAKQLTSRRDSIQSKRTSVGTSATKIATPDDTSDIILKNNDASITIWIKGDNTVAADTDGSYPLNAGEVIELDNFRSNDNNEIYGIVSSGTATAFTFGTIRL